MKVKITINESSYTKPREIILEQPEFEGWTPGWATVRAVLSHICYDISFGREKTMIQISVEVIE